MMPRTLQRLVERAPLVATAVHLVPAVACAREGVDLVAHLDEGRGAHLVRWVVFAAGVAGAGCVAEPAGVFDCFTHSFC